MKMSKKIIPMLVIVSALVLAACGDTAPTPTTVVQPTQTTVMEATAEATETSEVMEATPSVEDTPEAMEETPAATTKPSATEQATPAGGGTNSSSAIDLLNKASQAMKGLKSYHMSLTTDAASASTKIEADVQVPDRLRMTIDLGPSGMSETLVIGGETFTKLPGSDSYVMTPGGAQTSSLSDATSFAQYAENAEVVGDETIDGVSTTHVKFVYDQDKAVATVATPVAGAASMGKADAEIWIVKDTGYMKKVTYSSNAAGTPSTVTIVYSKFDEPITPPIEKPSNVTTMPGMEGGATPTP